MHNEKEIIDLAIRSLNISKKTVNEEFKSPHWDIFPKDFANLVSSLDSFYNFRSNGLTCMLDDKRAKANTLEAFIDLSREIGVDFINKFSETKVGNPDKVVLKGRSYNYNDLYMVQFAYKIINNVDFEPKIICDIGGGYGALASKLKSKYSNATLVLLDLPEVNVLQTYYISQLFPKSKILTLKGLQKNLKNNEKITKDLLIQYDFVILPGWFIENLDNEIIDIVINTRSMMEMHISVVNYYILNIQKKLKKQGIFYCVNRYVKYSVGYPIRLIDYGFDNYWGVIRSSVSWRQPKLHELIIKRSMEEEKLGVIDAINDFLTKSTIGMNEFDINRTLVLDEKTPVKKQSKTALLAKITFKKISRNLLKMLPYYIRYVVYKIFG